MMKQLEELLNFIKNHNLARLMIYLRQILCLHSWTIEESVARERPLAKPLSFSGEPDVKVSALCHKCLYHQTFWKFSEDKTPIDKAVKEEDIF